MITTGYPHKHHDLNEAHSHSFLSSLLGKSQLYGYTNDIFQIVSDISNKMYIVIKNINYFLTLFAKHKELMRLYEIKIYEF